MSISQVDELCKQSIQELAKNFVGLIFPRLINQFNENTQYQIEALREMKERSNDPALNKELNEAQARLKNAMSESAMTSVMEKTEAMLVDTLTVEELAYAIFHETTTIKISGIAAQLETAFREAVGEA